MGSSRVISAALAVAVTCASLRVGAAPAIEVRHLPGPEASSSPESGCDPNPGTWCDAVGWPCNAGAGLGATTDCSVRVEDHWSFNEGDYCLGCRTTFYVVVECGREMHLPLDDMEGARVTVTEVLTGRPVTLRCLNDAAKGHAPELMRCVGQGGGRGYGPAFDQSVASGDTISWGFPDCTWAGELTCSDMPRGGGTVARASPGEMQTMDCSVGSPYGLCGVYRVDLESGGFEWDLFANCDGSAAPQFQIFFDCSEALAAFDPRPELALTNLQAIGNCPAVDVSFELQNLGCSDAEGSVPVRIVSDCPPMRLDIVVPGPIPANGAVAVSVPFNAGCAGTITVTVDPDNVIPECTEANGVASCNQASGVRSLQAAIECCAAMLEPRAGDVFGCAGDLVVLDGSASSVAPCADPRYRWLDAAGAVVQDWSSNASLAVAVSCPADATYTLEASCAGEPCVGRTTATAWCVQPIADAGPDARACQGDPIRLSAASSMLGHCPRPEYRWLFEGAEVRGWDADPMFAIASVAPALAGVYTAEVRCEGLACVAADDVVVACDVGAACCRAVLAPVASNAAGCAGDRVLLDGSASLIAPCARPLYRWSGGAGPEQDWSPDSHHAVIVSCPQDESYVLEIACDGESCSASTAVRVSCSGGPAPPEAAGLRVARSGSTLSTAWQAVDAVDGYRIARGSIDALRLARTYDHAADAAAGAGTCDTGLATTWTDPDDASDGARWYYLVIPWTACGGDAAAGFARVGGDALAEPARQRTPTCP